MSSKTAPLFDLSEVFWSRALIDNVEYEAKDYTPSAFVSGLSRVFRLVRYPNSISFPDYFSSSEKEQYDYVSGILFFCYFIAGFSLVWALVLLILKCKGEDVGCASGNAFKTYPYQDHKTYSPSFTVAEEGSISLRSSRSQRSRVSEAFEIRLEEASRGARSGQSSRGTLSTLSIKKIKSIRRRARQTQFCFLLFGTCAFICVMILLIWSFSKIGQSLESSEMLLLKTQDTFDEVSTSLQNVETSFNNVRTLANITDLQFSSFCPNGTVNTPMFGIDLEEIAEGTIQSVSGMELLMEKEFISLNQTWESVKNIKDQTEIILDHAIHYSWTVPLYFFLVTVVLMFSMMGVIFAWRGTSGRNFQNFMSYGVLFFIIIFCTLAWLGTMIIGVTSIVSSDICTAGGRPGGPDKTIEDIADQYFTDRNETLYNVIIDYTNGCKMQDPLNRLTDIESSVETMMNSIWREISRIEGIGRDHFEAVCGSPLDEFLGVAHEVTRSFSGIRKALKNTKDALDCSKINPIYTELIHEELCGEIANGLGIGFIWLLMLSICLMVVLSLRAAWRHDTTQESDKSDTVYDEGEEVMFHDEYEEYLEYISKYKHEWEVYEGIESDSAKGGSKNGSEANNEEEEDYMSNSSISENNSGSYCDDDSSGFASSHAESTIPDDISFPSLQITPSVEAGFVDAAVIPSLLPTASSDEEEEMDTFHFESLDVVDAGFSRIRKDEDLLLSPKVASTRRISNEIKHAASHLTEKSKRSSLGEELDYILKDSSSDGNSEIMRTMSSFEHPAAPYENIIEKDTLDGAQLRTKESIEAELDRRFGRG